MIKTNLKQVKGKYFLVPQPANPSFWSVVLPIKKSSDETLDQIKKEKVHLWKMIIKILHFYILLTMKRDSVLINISTRLSYTDYTQQLF